MPSPSTEPRSKTDKRSPLPELFARDTHLLGWQGLTVNMPVNWNPRSFSGDHTKGNLRVADEEGLRLEVLWEQPQRTADIQKSIEKFLANLANAAKKNRKHFEVIENPKLVNAERKGKPQLVNFGWMGERGDPEASQGWGVAWECPECSRVTVAHVVGRGAEKRDRIQRLASEVLSTLECHGSGGWETWGVFDLQLEVPEQFQMSNAKLLISRLEFEWTKAAPPPPRGWIQPSERIALLRLPVANVVLENESLEKWTERVVARPHKRMRFGKPQEITVHGHHALLLQGRPRDFKRRITTWILDRILRRRTPPGELRVWSCEESNKIFALSSELSQRNLHVTQDVLDSLECHK